MLSDWGFFFSAFNLNVLKGFIPIFDLYAVQVVKDMEQNLNGEEFDLLYPLAQLTARSTAGNNMFTTKYHTFDQGPIRSRRGDSAKIPILPVN